MITGGNATLYVYDLDRAVEFYTETLGLKLQSRFENEWASVFAPGGFMIGLHSVRDDRPEPGTDGSITIGLWVDEKLEDVQAHYEARGVNFRGHIVNEVVRLAYFTDPDGNLLYFGETDFQY